MTIYKGFVGRGKTDIGKPASWKLKFQARDDDDLGLRSGSGDGDKEVVFGQ